MNYIFSTGTARGGTGLLTRMLSVHPKAEIALDPYLQLYRSLRTAIVNDQASEDVRGLYDPASPFQDYYFRPEQLKMLDLIQKASIDIPFDESERLSLTESLKKRAVLSSGDLVEAMDQLKGDNYLDLFLSGIDLIKNTRKKTDADWIGIHENWTVEFLQPLALAFSEAKFIIILRDPRAVTTSNMKVANEADKGHILSYARCIRKLMAFAIYYETLPIFKNRLRIVRYEDLILSPEENCKDLCTWLEIDYRPDMLDTDNYVEPSTGEVYNGFSSYESQASGFSENRINRWRSHFSDGATNLIDFVCGPEMKYFGYSFGKDNSNQISMQDILKTLIEDNEGSKSWRVDFENPQLDYGFELFRQALLQEHPDNVSEELIRTSFLFREVYENLVSGQVFEDQPKEELSKVS